MKLVKLSLRLLAISVSVSAQEFTLTTSLAGSVVDGQEIQASGQAFYIGSPGPSTYCPDIVQPYCPNTTDTIFAGLNALSVEVPGGQQVFIRNTGALAFTQAHSANTGSGSYFGGWYNLTSCPTCTATTDVYNWKSPGYNSTGGVLACPVVGFYAGRPAYRIYIRVPTFNTTGCTELTGLQPNYFAAHAVGAWQYT